MPIRLPWYELRPSRTIRARIFLWVLLAVGPVFLVSHLVGTRIMERALLRLAESQADTQASYVTSELSSVLGQVQMRASSLAVALEVLPVDETHLAALIGNLVESNPRIYGSAISFEPFALSAQKADVSPYVHRATAGGLRYVDLATPEYRYRDQEWYRIPRATGEARWSEPYFDDGGGEIWMITYSAPFRGRGDSAGAVRGVVTADLSLGWLRGLLDSLQIVEGGTAYLLSPGGVLVSHLDTRGAGPTEGSGERDFVTRAALASRSRTTLRTRDLAGTPVYVSHRALGVEGWKLALVSPEASILAPARQMMEVRLLFGALAVLALILAVSLLAGRITRPLGALAGSVRRIGAGDLETALPPVHGQDELAVLNNAVARMRTDLKGLIEQRAQAAAAQERLTRDLEIARRIQQSMLPRPWPGGERERFAVAAVLRPAREVGGDLYDFFELGDGRLLFAVGDVSDKGIPAALFMAEASAVLGAIARSGQPAETILAHLDERLSHDNEAAMFLTLWCGALDGETGRLDYASAGHEAPLLRRAGGGVTLLADDSGPALGLATGGPFTARTTHLAAGDALVLCTDGVTEAFGARGEAFGIERLMEIVDHEPIHSLPDKVVQEVERFSHADYPPDDVTVLAVAYRGAEVELVGRDPEEWRFAMAGRREEVVRLMARLEGTLRARQVPEEVIADCLLMSEEALVNVALYAYKEEPGRRAFVEARLGRDEVRLRFIDDGPPYDPLSRPDPDLDLPIAERPVGGLGVFLVKQLASESEYSHDGGHNILTVTRRWSAPAVA